MGGCGRSDTFPPHHHPLRWLADFSFFKDDVTVIRLLGVSFYFSIYRRGLMKTVACSLSTFQQEKTFLTIQKFNFLACWQFKILFQILIFCSASIRLFIVLNISIFMQYWEGKLFFFFNYIQNLKVFVHRDKW
jgi:hypothetical protein